jgi:hypothetical protein
LYQSLIDSFMRELLKLNLSPSNEVHIEEFEDSIYVMVSYLW